MNKHCLEEFKAHYECLDNANHQLYQCRRPERVLNRCVFQKIVCKAECIQVLLLTNSRDLRRRYQTLPRANHLYICATIRLWPHIHMFYEAERRTLAS
jgi:hypothetical protein